MQCIYILEIKVISSAPLLFTFSSNLLGIFRNPSPDHLIEVTIEYSDGLDQGINFITLGDGDDFSSNSSIVFRRTGHHEARGYQFSLKKIFLRNAFWVKFETATKDLKITLGINLVRNGKWHQLDCFFVFFVFFLII